MNLQPTPNSLLNPDRRRPGQPMQQSGFKLPADLAEQLALQAERLGCHRSELARALLRQGLEQLEVQG